MIPVRIFLFLRGEASPKDCVCVGGSSDNYSANRDCAGESKKVTPRIVKLSGECAPTHTAKNAASL